MTDEELRDLYHERADYSDLESDCQDAKKFVRHGGIFWRLFDWIEKRAAEDRREIDVEIRAALTQKEPTDG